MFASLDRLIHPPIDSTPYKVLGISRWSNEEAIKRAWRKAMMTNHPDLGGNPQLTVEINEAYHLIRKKRGF